MVANLAYYRSYYGGYYGNYYRDYCRDCCKVSYKGYYRSFYYLTWLRGQELCLLLYNSPGAVGVKGDILILKLNRVKNL